MRHKTVEITLTYSLKSLREIRHIKQGVLAAELFIDQSVYSRMENMEIPFTMTEIYTTCCYLKLDPLTFLSIVLIIAESYQSNNILPDRCAIKSLFTEILNEDFFCNLNQVSNIQLRTNIELLMQKLHKNFIYP
jgi:transcriptional regulator with XRE-family HTH domain